VTKFGGNHVNYLLSSLKVISNSEEWVTAEGAWHGIGILQF
jgi:hypothetical protein